MSTLQYSDNSQNSLSSHGLDEEGSRSVCLSDHILRSEQSIYRLVWAWKEAAFGWSPSLIDTTLWSWEVGRLDNMSTPLPNTATTQTQPQNMHPVLKGAQAGAHSSASNFVKTICLQEKNEKYYICFGITFYKTRQKKISFAPILHQFFNVK